MGSFSARRYGLVRIGLERIGMARVSSDGRLSHVKSPVLKGRKNRPLKQDIGRWGRSIPRAEKAFQVPSFGRDEISFWDL